MQSNISTVARPPVGFVVEGRGEYNCYPSLFCRCIGGVPLPVPRVNAGGYTNIIKRLKEHLTDLCISHKPYSIIVTIDLRDVIREKHVYNCQELLVLLKKQVEEWFIEARSDKRLHPLPVNITPVIQVHTFESWIIADLKGLKKSNYILKNTEEFTNVEEIGNPAKWLRENMVYRTDIKNPHFAKGIISVIDPDRMKKSSASFDKFYRECCASYSDWVEAYINNES